MRQFVYTRRVSSALAEGHSLGRYELVSRIGSGTVERWLARQSGVGKQVEVRVVTEDVDAALERARVIAQLEHANVASVLDVGTIDGVHFVVTEHLEGETLAAILEAGRAGKRLDELGLSRIIADAAEGVDAAHDHADSDGAPHHLAARRLSPSTIIVLYNGAVKVVALDAIGVGPVAYTAPERLDSAAVTGDRRGDVFALGTVLWEALTAERLFNPAERLPPAEASSGDEAVKRLVRHLEESCRRASSTRTSRRRSRRCACARSRATSRGGSRPRSTSRSRSRRC